MGIVEQYLLQLKIEKRRLRRAATILTVLSLLVATGVSWNLRMTGMTIANGATCCLQEHQHSDQCPAEKVLICGYPADPSEEVSDDLYAEPDPYALPEIRTIGSFGLEPVVITTTEKVVEDNSEELPDIIDLPITPATDELMEEPIAEPTVVESAEEPSVILPPEESTTEPTVVDPFEEVITESTVTDPSEAPTDIPADLPEDLPSEGTPQQHIHTEECYQITYLCNLEEHIHILSCYSDATADIESPVIWEATLPELTGEWAEDLVLLAQSQLGCGESERNYIVLDDGETKNGITRYGQWYGNPHGDWSAMFVMFCLEYAEIPEESIPWSPGVYNMMRKAKSEEILTLLDENIGTIGNLLFLDTDENEKADRIVIVTAEADGDDELTVIGGDLENFVQEIMLPVSDSSILGYINIQQAQERYSEEESDVPVQESGDPTLESGDPTLELGAPTLEPGDPTLEPGAPTLESGDPILEPGAPTLEPGDPMLEPGDPTLEPGDPTLEPGDPTLEPGDPTLEPDDPTLEPELPLDGAATETNEPSITLSVEFPEDGILRVIALLSNIEDSLYSWQWQYSEDGNEPWCDIDGATDLVLDMEDTEENFLRHYRLQGHQRPMRFMVKAFARDSGTASGTTADDTLLTSESITPFSIGKNNNVYTIDVYAYPVDPSGNRISTIELTDLGSYRIDSTTKTSVSDYFDNDLGAYQSAYFGTETSVTVQNVAKVWRYRSGQTYYLAYEQTNGTQNTRWKNRADNNISLYLKYIPQYDVTFESDGFAPLTESINYGAYPTLTAPGTWSREGYTLLGWIANGNEQLVYTYEDLLNLPVTSDVTYIAKWAQFVTVSFNPGDYEQNLYPISPMTVAYGSPLSQLPTPSWRYNSVAMAFDGWYLNAELTEPVAASYAFYEDTILYAKWSPKDEGYFVYFMDFARDDQAPLVLMTYSVTEGQTTAPYTPTNVPEGMAWDGKWYLDSSCENVYHFSIPVSQMTDYLTGANNRDLYLYPGAQAVCRAIFVTYGTKIDPITVHVGETINLDRYAPQRDGYVFTGWTLKDGIPVSGNQVLTETTTYYATWAADYVPFEAILRIENANDTDMTQADILGTWYAKAGSRIRVKSTYTGSGTNRTGTHEVVCVLDGVEYPVYTDAALTQKATLSDVYSTYFIYNNAGTSWSDEVNWDDVYTGGELPYSTRPISSSGDTIINFDYMRVRNDIVFTIPNSNSGAYIDVFKLYKNGSITGSVTYTGSTPIKEGSNVSATGVSGTNVRWSYTAASGTSGNNLYTLHDMKYGQRIYEVYPVGGSWLTPKSTDFHWYRTGSNELFSSRREDLSSDFFTGSGRKVTPVSLTAEFADQNHVALMYAVECLAGETADFTINGVGYKVQTQLCEVVNHTGDFSIKDLLGCEAGINPLANQNTKYYSKLNTTTATVGGTSVKTLFGTTYWPYYKTYVSSLSDIDRAYIFYYNRLYMNIQFNFAYDSDNDGRNETVEYENIAFGEKISEYQFGMPNYAEHALLQREGYEFAGWLDANGYVLEADDWASMVATGDSENSSMIFIAKWEKVSNNIVEYYEDVSANTPFESHYFDDGSLLEYPTMTVYPEGWVWQEYGEGKHQRFDWDVPMYGEYGVQELREINGETVVVNVIRIYGTWDESHTRIVYDPNPAQGGVLGTAPEDSHEYTIWQSEVPVMIQGNTANTDPDMVFAGWLLDRDGIVYQPGDHVLVRWPRTMIFIAQWAKPDSIVTLRYDPNGGTPETLYPNDSGFPYQKNASAYVWNNTNTDGSDWFIRPGYVFTGRNTEPDGSGISYAPHSTIVLTAPVTTLYAQWEMNLHTLSLYKVDSETNSGLTGAVFGLYKYENDMFLLVESLTTGIDGHITFPALETDTLYKLVEEKPPNGYAIITKELFFRLRPEANTISLVFYDSAGNIISAPNGVTGEYVSGSKFLTLTVENLLGYALPSTGGIGTPLYILCGLILTSAPLVYGLSLRRRYERRSRQ